MGILKRFNDWLNSFHDIAPTIKQSEGEGFKLVSETSYFLASGDTYNLNFKDPVDGSDSGTVRLHGVGGGRFIAMVRPIK